MIHKLISSKTIIAKVISDLDLSEENLRVSDMQEWIGEAVHKIGGIEEMNQQVSGINDSPILELCNYQTKLPCELNNVLQAAFSFNQDGPWYPMRYNTSTMFNSNIEGRCDNNRNRRSIQEEDLVTVYLNMNRSNQMTREQARSIINSDNDLRTVLNKLIGKKDWRFPAVLSNGLDFTKDITYSIKPGYLVCNQRDGFIKLAYSYVPRDEYGYVMIPDNESCIEAIYWYIVWKLQYPMYVRGEIPQYVYYDSQRNWNFYRKQAYGNIKMPNIDQWESIKNAWLQVYPIVDSHNEFFSTTGEQQLIYNRNN